MTRPKIAVLDAQGTELHALPSTWEKLAPVEFVPVETARDLQRELSRQRFDAAIVHYSKRAPSGAPLWAAIASEHPVLPIAVWGSTSPVILAEARSAPVVSVCSDQSLLEFLSSEVISVTRGRLSGVSLPSVMQVLQMEQRTCRLRVRSHSSVGELFVRNGALVHASHRKFEPREAALTMLAWTDADVVFDRLPPGTNNTISESLDFLLIEAARLIDEKGAMLNTGALRVTGALSATSANWLIPAVVRGGADVLVEEVMAVSGALSCAVVDIEHRLMVASKIPLEDQALRLNASVADAMVSMATLLADVQLQSSTEDILVTVGGAHVLLRPLRVMPSLVLFATFDREISALGFVRSQVAKLADQFAFAGVSATS